MMDRPRLSMSPNRIAFLLGGVIVLSFVFGILMFLSPENRAQKIEETYKKYQARQEIKAQLRSGPSSSPAGSRAIP